MAIVATLSGGVVAATADDDPTREPEDEVRLSCCCGVSPGTEDDEGCLEVIVSQFGMATSSSTLLLVNLVSPRFLESPECPVP